MLEVKDLWFSYRSEEGTTPVLKGVDLTVREGQWLSLIGANGSGKSTLAMMSNGLLQPDHGRVTVDGIDTADDSSLWEIRQRVAYVFQNPENQIIGATVEEDVAFGPENLGLDPREIRRRVDEVLEITGMEQYRHQPPHRLSGGQLQKVALAGALAMKPKYLILDEACSMLDPQSREKVWESVETLHRDHGIAVISITHFPEEVFYGNGIALMENGRTEAILWQSK